MPAGRQARCPGSEISRPRFRGGPRDAAVARRTCWCFGSPGAPLWSGAVPLWHSRSMQVGRAKMTIEVRIHEKSVDRPGHTVAEHVQTFDAFDGNVGGKLV